MEKSYFQLQIFNITNITAYTIKKSEQTILAAIKESLLDIRG